MEKENKLRSISEIFN